MSPCFFRLLPSEHHYHLSRKAIRVMVAPLLFALLGASCATASPVNLGKRQDASSDSTSEASSTTTSGAEATGADASSTSESGTATAVPSDIANAASSFQSAVPSPTPNGNQPTSPRYPFSCPDDYDLTYAFNQVTFDETVEQLLPVVNWTNPLYLRVEDAEGNSSEAGATRTASFYGNLTQKEELDYIAYDQEVEGGFLVQIWNLTNGPLQYSDNPALEIYNYTTQLQIYQNNTDAGSTTVKLFSNLCASDQTLGYTSFSAYLGTLLSNMRIAASTSNQIPQGTSPGSAPSASESESAASASASASSSAGGVVGGGVPGDSSASESGSMTGDASSTSGTGGGVGGSSSTATSSAASATGAAGGSETLSSSASESAASESDSASDANSTGDASSSDGTASGTGAAAGGATTAASETGDSSASPTDSASSAEETSQGAGAGGSESSSDDSEDSSASPTSSETTSSAGGGAAAGSTASASGSDLMLMAPGEITACESAPIEYSGGEAPYFLVVRSARSQVPLSQIPIQSRSGTYNWTPSIRPNSEVKVVLSDRNGNTVTSQTLTVQQGSDTSCLPSV